MHDQARLHWFTLRLGPQSRGHDIEIADGMKQSDELCDGVILSCLQCFRKASALDRIQLSPHFLSICSKAFTIQQLEWVVSQKDHSNCGPRVFYHARRLEREGHGPIAAYHDASDRAAHASELVSKLQSGSNPRVNSPGFSVPNLSPTQRHSH